MPPGISFIFSGLVTYGQMDNRALTNKYIQSPFNHRVVCPQAILFLSHVVFFSSPPSVHRDEHDEVCSGNVVRYTWHSDLI